ncbi:MAG: hypothetical protein ACI4S9_04450, partial [Christensenellales bacterium]
MDAFLNWFFAFITTMFSGIWQGIKSLFLGFIHIFDFGMYFDLVKQFQSEFGAIGWILAILTFILVYAFWIGLFVLLVLMIRKLFRYRATVVSNEDLLEEIDNLHRDVVRLTQEKERILAMKCAGGVGDGVSLVLPEETESAPVVKVANDVAVAELPANENNSESQRFYRLAAVDEKYSNFQPPAYEDDVTLVQLCDEIRNFACRNSQLYYEIKTIRLMIAGFASTKMILLQGISGTGKTSLPYVMGKYFKNDTTIASVQPSWRDRSELFGFYNEFTKKFNETEVLRRIYESSFTDDVNIIVLDEMNIARIEYYFAEMLSILEMPDPEEWKIQLVSSVWKNDPVHLEDGKLKIPTNVWYVGTANNDDSTFAVSDKVYDRAFVINLDKKGVPFEAPEISPRHVSYSHVETMYREAVNNHPVSQEILDKIEKLDSYVIEHFRVAFGNRIMKQLTVFVPVYFACGGDELEGLDYMLATKVFRKFESLNIGLIRDEIKGLINFLDATFGKDKMT